MSGISWLWLIAGFLLGVMYEANRRRSHQGKIWALVLVTGVVGLLLFTGSYNRLHVSMCGYHVMAIIHVVPANFSWLD